MSWKSHLSGNESNPISSHANKLSSSNFCLPFFIFWNPSIQTKLAAFACVQWAVSLAYILLQSIQQRHWQNSWIWTGHLTAALFPGKLKKESGPTLWAMDFSTDSSFTAWGGFSWRGRSNGSAVITLKSLNFRGVGFTTQLQYCRHDMLLFISVTFLGVVERCLYAKNMDEYNSADPNVLLLCHWNTPAGISRQSSDSLLFTLFNTMTNID